MRDGPDPWARRGARFHHERAAGSSDARQATPTWPGGAWGSQKTRDGPVPNHAQGCGGLGQVTRTRRAGEVWARELHLQEQKALL